MTIKHMLLLITTGLLLGIPSVQAETHAVTTAADLAAYCAAGDRAFEQSHIDTWSSYREGYCTGYLTGILGGYYAFPPVKPRLCLPDGFTIGQMEKIFMKYINEHPEQLHLLARDVVIRSLISAFPCD